MPEPREIVEQLYDAFARADAVALLGCLHPDFEGHVSAGMPLGVGGEHHGGEAMLRDVWAPVFVAFGARPRADRILETVEGELVVVGRYVGRVPGTERVVDAPFAHVLQVKEEQVIRLEQITDTAAWPEPMATA